VKVLDGCVRIHTGDRAGFLYSAETKAEDFEFSTEKASGLLMSLHDSWEREFYFESLVKRISKKEPLLNGTLTNFFEDNKNPLHRRPMFVCLLCALLVFALIVIDSKITRVELLQRD
jgi:hypothetical protein